MIDMSHLPKKEKKEKKKEEKEEKEKKEENIQYIIPILPPPNICQKIKRTLDIENKNNFFIIKNRDTNKFGQDDFELLLENMDFCNLNKHYTNNQLYLSDFVIFINNTQHISEGNPYRPMCMGFINVYEGKTPHLYISVFCSNENYGKCATRLMNHIKYIGNLLNCKEIRLSSLQTEHTLQFYKKNGFINLFEDSVHYDHLYTISDEDATYKILQPIQGNVSIIPPPPIKKKSIYGKVIYTDSEGFTRKKSVKKKPSVDSKNSNKTRRSISREKSDK
jgi:hypothetical protein